MPVDPATAVYNLMQADPNIIAAAVVFILQTIGILVEILVEYYQVGQVKMLNSSWYPE